MQYFWKQSNTFNSVQQKESGLTPIRHKIMKRVGYIREQVIDEKWSKKEKWLTRDKGHGQSKLSGASGERRMARPVRSNKLFW